MHKCSTYFECLHCGCRVCTVEACDHVLTAAETEGMMCLELGWVCPTCTSAGVVAATAGQPMIQIGEAKHPHRLADKLLELREAWLDLPFEGIVPPGWGDPIQNLVNAVRGQPMSGNFNDRCPIQVARITSVAPRQLTVGEPPKVHLIAYDVMWSLTPEQCRVLAYELLDAAFDATNRCAAPRCTCGGALEPQFDERVGARDPIGFVCDRCDRRWPGGQPRFK